ncbi:hypothetical protein BH09ACT1_BH09ACT1_24950 [soil metagenome]
MSDSSDETTAAKPGPDENAGINAIRLDADRTRDELRETLDEIERRISPAGVAESVKRSAKRDPGKAAAIGAGVVAAVTGLTWFIVASRRRR